MRKIEVGLETEVSRQEILGEIKFLIERLDTGKIDY